MPEKEIKKDEQLEGYNNLLEDIKSIMHKDLSKTYKAVDNIKVQTYWHAEKSEISGILEILIYKNIPLCLQWLGMANDYMHGIFF